MRAWRSVSSFLNDGAETLNKAGTVFCPTAQGQISFLSPSLPLTFPPPLSNNSLPKSSVKTAGAKKWKEIKRSKINLFGPFFDTDEGVGEE